MREVCSVERPDILRYLFGRRSAPIAARLFSHSDKKSQKTLKGEFGELELETPRDRQATFDPKIVAKGQTRWTGFDDKIISMYARGMTTREIQAHLEEI
jgi:putative transposase